MNVCGPRTEFLLDSSVMDIANNESRYTLLHKKRILSSIFFKKNKDPLRGLLFEFLNLIMIFAIKRGSEEPLKFQSLQLCNVEVCDSTFNQVFWLIDEQVIE